MSYYRINLVAGVPYRQDTAGGLLLLDSPGAAGGVDIELLRNGSPRTKMPNRQAAFRIETAFDGVILTAAVDTVVGIFLSFENVSLGVADGSAVTVPDGIQITNDNAFAVPVRTVPGNPLEVSFAGTVEPVLGEVQVTNTDAQAIPVIQKDGEVFLTQENGLTQIVNAAPVVVGLAAVLLSSDATLQKLRIRNSHASAMVAIGGLGVTLANGAIQLAPGDMWVEDSAAGAAWYAISDTAATSVQVQGLK